MGIRILEVMTDRNAMIGEIQTYLPRSLPQELPKLGDASLFNLVTALVAIQTPGLTGELIVSIPRKVSDRLEIHWHSEAPQV